MSQNPYKQSYYSYMLLKISSDSNMRKAQFDSNSNLPFPHTHRLYLSSSLLSLKVPSSLLDILISIK